MKNKLIIIGIALSLVACRPGAKNGADAESEKVDNRKAVKTKVIAQEEISKKIKTNSTFEPKSEVAYTAPAGEVKKINYKNGDKVKKGELVVELTDENVKGNYLTAEAAYISAKATYEEAEKFQELTVKNNLVAAEATMISAKESYEKALRGAKAKEIAIQESNLKSAEESLKQAEFSYERNKRLYEEELISESTFIAIETGYQQALTAYQNAKNNLELTLDGTDKEDLRSLKANYNRTVSAYELSKKNVDEKAWEYSIARAKAQYSTAKSNFAVATDSYNDLTVETKISGVVSGLNLKQFEETGNEQVLFTVVDQSQMELTAGLTARELVELDRKARVEVYVDDLEETYEGKIVEIDPTADAATNKFNVKVIVDNSEEKLKKGMYSKVFFLTKAKKTLVVPKEAIVVKDLYTYVFVDKNGVAKRIRIELGIGTDDRQEIITEDIKPGDKIVVEGQFLLQDNEKIKEVE